MLSVRIVRILVSALAIFLIVAFFATSKNSLGDSILRVKTPSSGDNVLFEGGQEEQTNPLKSAPYSGSKPPYKEEDAPAKAGDKTKVYADKVVGGKSEKAPSSAAKPAKPEAVSGGSSDSSSGSSSGASGAECKDRDYVVMIDAGSTGSRVHVYEFNTCVSPAALLSEKFEMKKPGLSSFDTDTKGAAASLDSLLDIAVATVPKEKQGCTPVAVKATAGLRLLGKEKSDAILAEVRSHLEKDYPFAVVEGDGISIMEGKDEGVYAWITTNYLLGNIGSSEKTPTAAVFDLGGGSTQIVFEPEFASPNEKIEGADFEYKFSFAGRDFSLYQFSHLGYGLMEGRNKVNRLVVEAHLKANSDLTKYSSKKEAADAKASVTVKNPCIASGETAENVVVNIDDAFYVVNFKGPSSGGASGAQCRFLAESILMKDAECTAKPCSFNGIHQPSLTKSFKTTSDMYIFSYFYDRTNPLGFPSSFTVDELTLLTKLVCNGDELWKEVLFDTHIQELKKEPHWCLDLSFITALLHTGYNIPAHRELKTAKTIDNNELGWCLGASLPLLDKKSGGWTCREK